MTDAYSVRTRVLLIVTALAMVVVACGEAGPIDSPSPATTQIPASTATKPPPTSTTEQTSSTAPDVVDAIDTYRDEYLLTSERGEILTVGEHTAVASRWVQTFGSDDLAFETVAIGADMWERYDDGEWGAVDDPSAIYALTDHPFTLDEVTASFDPIGPGEHEGLPVEVYRIEGAPAIEYAGGSLDLFDDGTITVAVLADSRFASYEVLLIGADDQQIRLSYRIFDVGAEVSIARPEILPEVLSCRDPFTQLIEEVGAYRSRYDLLHTGAAFSSIEELRLEDPWAWLQTVYFQTPDFFIDTLWVNGGFQFWREPDGQWQEDLDGGYQAMTYRPFVDDLWLPDLVALYTPVGTDTVNGRSVDVYELGLDEVRTLNEGLTRNTDTLAATFWVEPCSQPALIKLEVVATGRGYADGEFHVVYELYDFGTTDMIDIPAEALDG